MKITNNIFVLSGSYFSAVNNVATLGEVYGIHTPNGLILIDCGTAVTGLAMLKETLSYFNVNEPITHCIITHAHHDHCGSAKELQEAGTIIIVGQEDAAYCTNGGVWGLNSPFDKEQAYPAFTPDLLIAEDQVLEINGISFEFIKVPGHTPGSMAIRISLDDKIVLFTGDMLQPDGFLLNAVNFGWKGDPFFNRQMTVDSMMKLMLYDTDMILPGHGKLCLRNGTSLLRYAAQVAFTSLR
ncbi:MBL fold metallo-hydrolase [Paenibacillus sp. FSL H7-0350]|uniref:MBL fold metallo-hydrolase n=1 Tax=Paenibacillus sp. FSL H7-0350 TaxID=2975345 RepID=UPI003157F512